jgi:hypothetical protein
MRSLLFLLSIPVFSNLDLFYTAAVIVACHLFDDDDDDDDDFRIEYHYAIWLQNNNKNATQSSKNTSMNVKQVAIFINISLLSVYMCRSVGIFPIRTLPKQSVDKRDSKRATAAHTQCQEIDQSIDYWGIFLASCFCFILVYVNLKTLKISLHRERESIRCFSCSSGVFL